jgi:uncharacterized iron-regulated membrane protein
MRFIIWNRKLHYWIAFCVALPLLLIISTGLLLQVKKYWAWVQPPEQKGTGTVPSLDLEEILVSMHGISDLKVLGWDDVNRIDVRPSRALAKVWLKNGWEVQVDLGTGRILHSAYRRSDLIESIHDGSFFAGNWSKFGIFFSTGLALLILLLSGLYMFWQPISAKQRVRKLRDTARPVI